MHYSWPIGICHAHEDKCDPGHVPVSYFCLFKQHLFMYPKGSSESLSLEIPTLACTSVVATLFWLLITLLIRKLKQVRANKGQSKLLILLYHLIYIYNVCAILSQTPLMAKQSTCQSSCIQGRSLWLSTVTGYSMIPPNGSFHVTAFN